MLSFISSLNVIFALYSRQPDSNMNLIIALFFFGPIVLAFAYYIYISRYDNQWENGIFPENLKYSRDNLMEAYICLAALMIQRHKEDSGKKLIYMNTYFQRYFKNETYNFSESILFSYRHPIKPKTVAKWINKHINETAKRHQIIYFLAGVASVDGQFTERELALLKEINLLIGLELKDFELVIAQYKFTRTDKDDSTSSSNSRSSNSSSYSSGSSSSYRVELAFKVLGLQESAPLSEIKKAYRKLAMQHHPDKFMNESKDQQELAHERFQKILDAYELLEKLKKD